MKIKILMTAEIEVGRPGTSTEARVNAMRVLDNFREQAANNDMKEVTLCQATTDDLKAFNDVSSNDGPWVGYVVVMRYPWPP